MWATLIWLWWYAAIPVIIFFTTLNPRLSLARSLDLVTDESVYIPIGTLDVTLLQLRNLTHPAWRINYEAPALPKLIIGWGSLYGARHDGAVSGWLYGARAPAAWLSAFALVALFYLAWPIIGRRAAALGTLALALSPWLAFFGALAYLDTYLLCFMTLAAVLIWHAARRPWLYPLVGLFAGLAFASKYTAAALVAPAALYLWYYYRHVARQRPPKRLLLAPVVALVTVYITDPPIWTNPIGLLWSSMIFQFNHASNGHDVFWNGAVWEHVPPGIGIFILVAKLSLWLTVPAALAALWACWMFWRAWRDRATRAPGETGEIRQTGETGETGEIRQTGLRQDRAAFLLAWLLGLLVPFGALPIVVGTHYMLPLAPPVAFIAAWGLITVVDALAARYAAWLVDLAREVAARMARLAWLSAVAGWGRAASRRTGLTETPPTRRASFLIQAALTAVVAVALIAPPAHGLATTQQAEGYTAGWLQGENGSLQVAYPAYADGIEWVVAHSSGRTTVTLIGARGSLDFWRDTRQRLFPQRIRLSFGTPDRFAHSQYIIWPEHLVQRRFPTPPGFDSMIAARIQGGATTYCYILRWPNPDR